MQGEYFEVYKEVHEGAGTIASRLRAAMAKQKDISFHLIHLLKRRQRGI